MSVRYSPRFWSLLGALLFASVPAHAGWVVENLGTMLTTALDVNSKGQVLGLRSDGHTVIYDKTGVTSLGLVNSYNGKLNDQGMALLDYQFIYRNGALTDLGSIPDLSPFLYATDMNNAGQVVGSSHSWGNFVYDAGTLSSISPNGAPAYMTVRGINNAGLVVGGDTYTYCVSFDPLGCNEVRSESAGYIYELGSGAEQPLPYKIVDINDQGQAVGFIGSPGGDYGPTLINGNSATTLGWGTLGDQVLRINNAGQVLFQDDYYYLYDQGQVINLSTLVAAQLGVGAYVSSFVGLADGYIVGHYIDDNGVQGVFLLTSAVDEPASISMAFGGLALLAAIARRRRRH